MRFEFVHVFSGHYEVKKRKEGNNLQNVLLAFELDLFMYHQGSLSIFSKVCEADRPKTKCHIISGTA